MKSLTWPGWEETPRPQLTKRFLMLTTMLLAEIVEAAGTEYIGPPLQPLTSQRNNIGIGIVQVFDWFEEKGEAVESLLSELEP